MKKYIPFLLCLLSLGLAEVSSNMQLSPLFSNTPTKDAFDLTLPEDSPPYTVTIEDKYAPGMTMTINVFIASANMKPTAVTAVLPQGLVPLREFRDQVWIAHYVIPATYPTGDYTAKVYIKMPERTIAEKLNYKIEQRIAHIYIEGSTVVSANKLLELLTIKEGEVFNQTKAQINRSKILEQGLFDKVTMRLSTTPAGVVVKYYVKENPRIENIVISGSREFSEIELQKVFILKPGMVLDNRQLQKDVLALESFYKEKEYMFFRVLRVERPTSENGRVLRVLVNEGKIRNIILKGNTNTKDYVITREMDIKSGDVFNSGKLREDLRRIYNLNYFSSVMPDFSVDENTDEVDLELKLEEKKTSSVNFGGGYGQLQGWFGFVDLFLDNIAGTAQSTLLKAQFGQRITSYQFKYHNPWMWDNKTSFTMRLWSTYGYNYLSGGRELRNGWSPSIGFQRSLYVQESYGFRYEDVFNLYDRSQDYLDRALIYSWTFDNRDQWMNPTKGFYNQFAMDHSARALGGTINASRYSVQFNQFLPLAEKQVWAMRQMYNYQLGDIFPSEQYYVGSDSTVRGYDPMKGQAPFAKGNERAVLNFEYRYLFNEMFTGVMFYDIGQAIKPVYDPLDADRDFTNHHGWGSGLGFGVRIITPMGPLRLDYAWPQYKEFSEGFLNFNMGHVF